jgi:hypothetical protein
MMSSKDNQWHGLWEVWRGEFPPDNATAEEREEEWHLEGIFEGFVDEIGFRLAGPNPCADAFCFRRASDNAGPVCALNEHVPGDICLVDVEQVNGDCVSWVPEAIPEFFAGRPVTADSWGGSIRLSRLDTEAGQAHAARKRAMDLILGKLAPAEIQTLVEHGLQLHTY